jgi:hypothetical protein
MTATLDSRPDGAAVPSNAATLSAKDVSIGDCLRALLFAAVGATAIYFATNIGVAGVRRYGGSVLVPLLIYSAFSFAAGLLLVFPVLIFVPSLRRPQLGLAAVWGVLVPCALLSSSCGRRRRD